MKLILTLTAALIGGIALPTLTFAGTVLGCETVATEGSNYTTKADPTCAFTGQHEGQTRGLVPASFDTDNDPLTPAVPGIGMSDVPGAGLPLGG